MADMSRQWQKLTEDEFGRIDAEVLASFRAPGSKNKFVAWDPFERSSRYFKFLLLSTALRQSQNFFDAYRKIENRHVGSPLTVRCAGCDIDADYLAAVEEWEFLQKSGALSGVSTVVEIGAGFGRTCHTLLTLAPDIESYVIVDLPPMLALSRAYLERAIPGRSVTFISSDDQQRFAGLSPDLVINIDSFQEMPPHVIDGYMTNLVQRAPRFYCKNPVGKYLPASVGRPDLDESQLLDVFKLGYCRNIIDIFNDDELRKAREAFLIAYCPPPVTGTSAAAYTVAASHVMDLFPYFQHVLYTR